MTRWKAAGIHLLLSAGIATCVIALFVLAWFPPPHFQASGGLRLLRIVFLVHVVLGPLLTLIVYRTGKPGLRMDLTIIAALQLAALTYGLTSAHATRPMYVVVTPDRANLVRANEIVVDKSPAGHWAMPSRGITAVALRRLGSKERSQLVEAIMEGAPDIDYRPAFYVPLRGNVAEVAARAEPLTLRLDADPTNRICYRQWMTKHDVSDPEPLRILPLIGSDKELEVVVDTRAGNLVGYLPLVSDFPADCQRQIAMRQR